MSADSRYAEHRRFVEQIARKFHRRYGGAYDDWLSDAQLAYANAVATYDPGRGALAPRVGVKVRHDLLTALKRRLARRRHEVLVPDCSPLAPAPRPGGGAFAALSPDAESVAHLLLRFAGEPPGGARGREAWSSAVRYPVAQMLLDVGWAWQRVFETFRELGRAFG
jgi:hypothetical protein